MLVNLVRRWPALTEKTVAGIHFVQEDGGGESWIVTIPGHGYRFLGSPGRPAADKSTPTSSSPVAEEPSLAVLPFLNLSSDPEQD